MGRSLSCGFCGKQQRGRASRPARLVRRSSVALGGGAARVVWNLPWVHSPYHVQELTSSPGSEGPDVKISESRQ